MNPSAPPSLAVRILQIASAVAMVACFGSVLYYVNCTLGLYNVSPDLLVNAVNLALPWLMLGGAAWAIANRLLLRFSLPTLVLVSSFLAYLAWDDPAPPPPTAFSPVTPQDSKSYAAYRWFLKSGEGSRVQETPAPSVDLPDFPRDKVTWTADVAKHRQTWEAAWTADTLGREWIAAMAAHQPEGFFPNRGTSTPMVEFSRIRYAAKSHWARAHLLLADGQVDEAARILLTVVRAAYNLQRGGTTFLTLMVADSLTRGSYERLDLLLDSGALSGHMRAEISGVLQQAPSTRQNIRQAFIGEEIWTRSVIAQIRDPQSEDGASLAAGGWRFAPDWLLNRLLFNPNRTERAHVEYLAGASQLAQARQTGTTEKVELFERMVNERTVKNPFGQILAAMSLPGYGSTGESSWKTDDLRLDLLKRLTPPPTEK
jgi:hypothetical protein